MNLKKVISFIPYYQNISAKDKGTCSTTMIISHILPSIIQRKIIKKLRKSFAQLEFLLPLRSKTIKLSKTNVKKQMGMSFI